MKKILISIIIVLLLILNFFAVAKGIDFGMFKVYGFKEIRSSSEELDENINKAKEISEQTYPSEVKDLEEVIEKLRTAKQEYENKKKYSTEAAIGSTEVKTYKVHYLWAVLGNYKTSENIKSLSLDLKSTKNADVYDLKFTLVGDYDSVTDYISKIENNDNLNFKVENFVMEQYQTQTTTVITSETINTTKVTNPFDKIVKIITKNLVSAQEENLTEDSKEQADSNNKSINSDTTTITYNPKWVETTFTVKDIGITLD